MQRDHGHAEAEVGTCHERHRSQLSTRFRLPSMGQPV
jgi:hypothetical protein